MLVKSTAHRISLSQVLQDTELRKSLENPVDGKYNSLLLLLLLLMSSCRTLERYAKP